MKVAFSHDWLTGMRGGEKVLEAMACLFPEADIHTLVHNKRSLSPKLEARSIHTSFLQNWPGVATHYKYYLPLFPSAMESLKIDRADLVISSSHCVAKGIRPPTGARHIAYCHTPMRYAWLFFNEYFGAYPAPARVAIRMMLARLREWDVESNKRVDAFVANSQHVRRRIREFYGRESRVIYPPVDTDFYTPTDGPRGAFYLIVSALVPYKRVDLAIEAFNGLGLKLVVVGDGPMRRGLERAAGPTVQFAGRKSDADLREYFRACRGLVFPGEEDFGIVPVEAQACGAPVIAYARGGALETVAEGKTGVFFREQTAVSLQKAILAAENTRWNPDTIRLNAERFSTARFTREFYAAAMEAVGERASA